MADLAVATRVVLSCGHERVAEQWSGHPGATYCCNVCGVLASMLVVEPTSEPPGRWHFRGTPLPDCPGCGCAPGGLHAFTCAATGFWRG